MLSVFCANRLRNEGVEPLILFVFNVVLPLASCTSFHEGTLLLQLIEALRIRVRILPNPALVRVDRFLPIEVLQVFDRLLHIFLALFGILRVILAILMPLLWIVVSILLLAAG